MYGAIGSSMLAGFLIAKLTQRARGSAAKLRKLPARVFEEIAFLPEQWTLRPHDFKVNGAFLYLSDRRIFPGILGGQREYTEAEFSLLLHTSGGWSMFSFISTIQYVGSDPGCLRDSLIKQDPQLYIMETSSLEKYNTAIETSHNISQARKAATTLRSLFTGAPLMLHTKGSVGFQGSP